MKKVKACVRMMVEVGILTVLFTVILIPAWTIQSAGLWGTFLLIFGLVFIVEAVICYLKESDVFLTLIITGGLVALCLLCLIVGALTGAPLFRAKEYQAQIAVNDGTFATDVIKIESGTYVPIVDSISAEKLGDRTMGNLSSDKVSQFEVSDEYSEILYQGKWYRISPLEYGGLFKYLNSKSSGIPGYVLVDIMTQESILVENQNIQYAPSAYYSKDLGRHLRNNYPTYIFGDNHFEINEKGERYYVVPVYTVKLGLFGGKIITSVVIVECSTGICQEYSLQDVPEWVDVVYPVEYIMDKVGNHYKYIHGYWNVSKKDVKTTSYSYRNTEEDSNFDGYSIIPIDGKIQYSTGLTSAGADESNVGFVMIDARTGDVKYYYCPGAEESSGQASAEGLVQNLGYEAGYPIIINVDGVETYFMTLKDNSKLVKKVALVNVKDYTIVVVENTIDETITEYKSKITGKTEVEPVKSNSKTGEIESIYTACIEGYTYYYFRLAGDNNLYKSSIQNSDKQVAMNVLDKVTIEYTDSTEVGVKTVTRIDF